MAGETTITMIGNLTADPELRTINSGAKVASFTVASTPRTFNRDTNSWEDSQTLFMRCSAWRDLAEHCAQSLSKGMRVIVQGRLSQRSYQANDGTQRTIVEMTVDEIGPSLRNATAQVTRLSSGFNGRNGGNAQGGNAQIGSSQNGGFQGGNGYSQGGYSGGASYSNNSAVQAPGADPWASDTSAPADDGFSTFGSAGDELEF